MARKTHQTHLPPAGIRRQGAGAFHRTGDSNKGYVSKRVERMGGLTLIYKKNRCLFRKIEEQVFLPGLTKIDYPRVASIVVFCLRENPAHLNWKMSGKMNVTIIVHSV